MIETAPGEQEHGVAVEMTIPVVRRGRKKGGARVAEAAQGPPPGPKIPRITRLMALAIKFQDMVDRGEVRDYAEFARLGFVSRARMTQIMNLLNLAPDLQEIILDASIRPSNVDLPNERSLRQILRVSYWPNQRNLWGTRGALLGDSPLQNASMQVE